jgi:hypothetical protein
VCGNCPFAHEQKPTIQEATNAAAMGKPVPDPTYHCRRFPPTVTPIIRDVKTPLGAVQPVVIATTQSFAQVGKDWWCGEHPARQLMQPFRASDLPLHKN